MVSVVTEGRHGEKDHDAEEHWSQLSCLSQLIPFGDDRDKLGARGLGALNHHSAGSLCHKSFSSPQGWPLQQAHGSGLVCRGHFVRRKTWQAKYNGSSIEAGPDVSIVHHRQKNKQGKRAKRGP